MHPWELSVVPHPLTLHHKNVNNSAVDYSVSLKFCTEFKHMTSEVLYKFKVRKSKVTVTVRHNKFAKLSIIQPGIARFHLSFVQTLITWHLMYHKLSRSTGQRLRSQSDNVSSSKNAVIQTWSSCQKSTWWKLSQSSVQHITWRSRSLGQILKLP